MDAEKKIEGFARIRESAIKMATMKLKKRTIKRSLLLVLINTYLHAQPAPDLD
jgi:hypothetical protein